MEDFYHYAPSTGALREVISSEDIVASLAEINSGIFFSGTGRLETTRDSVTITKIA